MILFLPAAGWSESDGHINWQAGIRVYLWAVNRLREGHPYFMTAQQTLFDTGRTTLGECEGMAIRLATVVSGLDVVIVLFLPAAGIRREGTVMVLEDECRIWASKGSADNAKRAPYFRGAESAFKVGNYDRCEGYSVRLATVVSGLAAALFCSCLLRGLTG